MNIYRNAFPPNHAFNKTDVFQPKHASKQTKYVFRQDYDLEKLPETETITQPVGYKWKKAKELLKYAPQASKLPKENFFQRIKTYYDEGINTHEVIQDFGGFSGLDLIYKDLYGKPFPYIVRDPKIKKVDTSTNIAHKPYREMHYPYPEVIGFFTPNENDGITYKSTVPLNKIYNHFRQDGVPVGRASHQRLEKLLPKSSGMLLRSVERLPKAK